MENKLDRLTKMEVALKKERDSSWMTHWRDIADFTSPRRYRTLIFESNKGDKRNQKIINNRATIASRNMRAGMFVGMTSPSRPWFSLRAPDPELNEYWSVKEWLSIVEERVRQVFLRSNLYNMLPIIYGDEGIFGTANVIVMEDPRTVIRLFSAPVGSYVLSANENLHVDTIIRSVPMRVRQMVEKFGYDRNSRNVKNLWDRGQYDEIVEVSHYIGPNYWEQNGMADYTGMPFHSCYWETGRTASDDYLSEAGFEERPFMAPRWEVVGEDVYGSECPGMIALGDNKALQTYEKRKAQGVEKMINPPMSAPMSMRNQKASLLAGDITYLDVRDGQQGFRPTHEINWRIAEVIEMISKHEERISTAFYEDLFLMLASSDRAQVTAREVEERHTEKLLMLGPVLERQNSELLDPIIDRTFAIMARRGMIPRPPQEMEGIELRVEYVSIMAQAQKLLDIGSIERFSTYIAGVAQIKPDVVDKFNADQAVDEYGIRMGVPVKIIVPDEDVDMVRQARAQQQYAMQQAEMASQAAQNAQTLSQTRLGSGGSALDAVVDQNGEEAA